MSPRLAAIRARHRRRERRLDRALGRPAILSPDEAIEVHRRAVAGESVAKLADELGVSEARVRRCAHNRTIAWATGVCALPDLLP